MITEARIKQKKLETQLKIEAKIQELEVVLLLSARDCLVSTVFEVLLTCFARFINTNEKSKFDILSECDIAVEAKL